MIIPISSASDLSSINQTSIDTLAISDNNLVAIDSSSDVLTDGENNIYVAKNGNNSGSGSQSDPYGTIEYALEKASGTTNIYINEGIYNEYSMTIKSNVNLIGLGNVVIDADNGGPIFNDNLPAEVYITLKDLTIKNANTSSSGSVLNIKGYSPLVKANVTLNNVTFINCYSKLSGAVVYDHGGSQANPFNNLTIVNCNFIGCSSPAGPVIYARGNTNIINSTFVENKYLGTTYSGSCIGIYAYASANITGCIFENNYADSVRHESGAIYTSASNSKGININNNVFLNNSNYNIKASSSASGSKVNAENNWFGTNDVNITKLTNNITINSYAVLDMSADPTIVNLNEKSNVIVTYYNNGTKTQNSQIPLRNITLSTTGGNLGDKKGSFSGEFETDFSSSAIGEYTITANVDNQEVMTKVVVRDLSNKTAIVAEPDVNYKDVTISVNVAPSTATGNVTFKLNGKDEIIYLNNAKGNITLKNVPIGEYDNIVLTYNGDSSHNPSTTSISFMVYEKYPSNLTAEASVSGSDVLINVEMEPLEASGNVTFTVNGNDEIIYLNNGKGNVTVNLPNNDYEVELTYNGDDDYATSTDTVSFSVLDRIPTELTVTPEVVGDCVTFYAKINETSATGNVTFYLKYRNQVIELENGEGNITIDRLTDVNYNVTFSYNGDINYEPSNTTVEFKVPANIKESVLTATATVKNQVVTIDVDIDDYRAEGNVTFTINGEDKVIDLTRSKGSIILENVDYGNYSIVLTYNGDESHYPSNYTLDFSVIYYPYGEIIYVGPKGKDTANATADDPLLTVSKAIDVANNYENVKKIYIYNGVYKDSNMTIERSYDIEGQSKENTIIDAQGGFLFEIYGLSNNNSFTNITLKNGYNENGGAIRDYANFLNVTDCIFENNTAGNMGGAIYHYYNDANIENSQFVENRAITGGAVYVSSYTNSTKIINSEFMGNEALSGVYAGGAIYNAGTLLVNNSEFTANKAVSKSDSSYDISGGDGGAIYNANMLLVDYSQFNQNSAYYWGGAIKTGGESYISNSNFTANTAGSRGGAIHTSGSGSYSAWTTYISNCTFDENAIVDNAYEGSTKIGGAICAEAPTAIRDSNFTANSALDGGAIFMRANAKYIDNCIFIDNSANNGGAIFDNRTQSIISNSTFINNNATLGGAVHVSSSYASSENGFTNLTGDNFYNNTAVKGGAIYSDAGVASPQELNIKYSEFVGNKASEDGSLIYTTNRANIENNALIFETNDNNVVWVNPQCEGLVSLEDNWWGVNDPNLERIVRGIVAPERFAVLNLSANPQKVEKNEASTITATLNWNDGTDSGVELIPFRDIELSTTIGNLTNSKGILDTTFESEYSSDIEGTYSIMANVDNEMQTVSVIVVGDAEVKNVIYVNSSNGDDKFGDGSINNPVKTIARAYSLVEENGTIIMNGYFTGNGNTKLGISSYINNITFIGVNNTVIDGEHKNWIFSISDGIFTFVNTTFQNAYYAGYGAAITNQAGYLFVENCTFTSNVAQGSSAIDNTGYLVVIGSKFADNIATVYDGGALSSSWEAYIINSTFTNNRAYQNGGAMKNYEEGYLYIERCEFTDNQAVGGSDGSYGGAVYSWASDVEIFLSNFTNNFANTKGGAVYASYGNSFYEWHAVVRQSIFEDNEATTGNSLFLELVTGDASYNVFLDDYNSVYTYSNYATIDNNWWGVNDPNWSNLLSGTIKKPNTYAVVNVTANPSEISPDSTSKLTYEFFWNGTSDNENASLIPKRSIEISSTGGKLSNDSGNFSDAKFETSFASNKSGIYEITANIDNEVLVINVTVKDGVIITPSVEVNGENVTINVELTPSDVDGNITFELNGKTYTIPISNGKGNITLTGLNNGNYTVNLEYLGDETYPYSNKTIEFTVDKYVPQNSTAKVNVSVDDKNNVKISVDVTPNDAEGNVTVIVGDKEYVLPLVNGKANMTISDLDPGNYTVKAKYSGDDKYLPSTSKSVSFTVNKLKDDVVLSAPDVVKYFNGSERLYVYLTDSKSNKLSGQIISITFNGVKYNRTTNENGSVSIAVNVNSGVYQILVEYAGNENYSAMSVNSTVTVKSTVNGTDVVKVYRNATQYYATFRDSQGNYLKEGTVVTFNINGVMYERKISGSEGLAKLNLNLEQGNYILTAMNPVTGENAANNITIIARLIENRDITKFYRNATQYTVKVLGDDGNPAGAGESVTFNINGVFYTRQTNASGIVKLNLNLEPGDYIITAEYKNCKVSNNIKILPVLSASDISMNYRDGTQFAAKLVDGQGNPAANEKIEFNVNGVFYYRTTGNDGIARLNINLMSGEYIITSSYNGANIANKITIH